MSPVSMELRRIASDVRQCVEDGDYDAALDAFRAADVEPADVPIFGYMHAMVAMKSGRWAEALDVLDELIVAEPGRAVIYLDRIGCLIRLGRLTEAAEALSQDDTPIRGLFPRWVYSAWVSHLVGRGEDCRAYLRHALTMNPAAAAMAGGIADLRPVLEGLLARPCAAPIPGGAGTEKAGRNTDSIDRAANAQNAGREGC